MAVGGYTRDRTALLLVDPYNDFLAEGAKLWSYLRAVAEEVRLLDNMKTLTGAVRKAGIRIFYVPHRRWEQGDYQGWAHPSPDQIAVGRRQTFFGVRRMVRAVLPMMRRQGCGRIVNIGSMAGLVPFPYRGIYSASKHVLEGYTETLDHEVLRFGIRAVLIEPAFTKTNIETNSKNTHESLGAYAQQKQRMTGVILDQVTRGDDPNAVAEIVYRALTDNPPRLRYPVGGGLKLSRLLRFVPAAMFDKKFRKRFHLDETGRSGP